MATNCSSPSSQLPGFDHRDENLAEVYPNEAGEFVQVWSGEYDGSIDSPVRVILSYLRTLSGPCNVRRSFILEGEFRCVEIDKTTRTFEYRDQPQYRRVEMDLPSGRVIVDDRRK